mmetsp:Transcript_8632/g.26742  ORF Transcript_8632/g.26742 Transcript_8632/m.26742 type:complete len:123 (+) Transcript_8632:2118-2486(+)
MPPSTGSADTSSCASRRMAGHTADGGIMAHVGARAASRGVARRGRPRAAPWRVGLRRTRAAGLWCAPLALTVALTLRARHHATGAGISYDSAEQQKLKQQGTGAAAGGLEAAGQTAEAAGRR